MQRSFAKRRERTSSTHSNHSANSQVGSLPRPKFELLPGEAMPSDARLILASLDREPVEDEAEAVSCHIHLIDVFLSTRSDGCLFIIAQSTDSARGARAPARDVRRPCGCPSAEPSSTRPFESCRRSVAEH